MEKKRFNNTNLEVSKLCLGTVNYGTALDDKTSLRQLSEFMEQGGNFIDSAHIYGNWVDGMESPSEKVIGRWFRETGKREQVVLATKGSHPDWGHMDIPRLHAADIRLDLEESLGFLQTDYIDLYFLHRDDPQVPVEEIIDCLDEGVAQGKIRYYGCSNWTLPRIIEAAAYARKKGSKGFVVNQLMLSLADINFPGLPDKTFVLMDEETHAYQKETGLNTMAYMSIAKAFFTRKAAGENLPESVSGVYENRTNMMIFEKLKEVVSQGEYSFIDLSLMYLMQEQDFPVIPIASFDDEEQLRDGLAACDKPVPEALMKELSALKRYVYRE